MEIESGHSRFAQILPFPYMECDHTLHISSLCPSFCDFPKDPFQFFGIVLWYVGYQKSLRVEEVWSSKDSAAEILVLIHTISNSHSETSKHDGNKTVNCVSSLFISKASKLTRQYCFQL